MSTLLLRHVWKHYGEQVVLENISLNVEHGEFCTLVGASGCGKSTFLRMLLGAERPTRGEIRLCDKSLPDEPGPDRGIVFQRYSVFPHLTALQNVMLGLELQGSAVLCRLWGRRRLAARERAMQMLEAVGLGAARDKYPAQLSGGMQQRLAIAQSLVGEPEVLLLDEPFGALDPGIRADMQALVKDLWRERGFTVFMVTHDIAEAFSLGTRLLVLDKARRDPHAPHVYGAQITYDIPLDREARQARARIEAAVAAGAGVSAELAATLPPQGGRREGRLRKSHQTLTGGDVT